MTEDLTGRRRNPDALSSRGQGKILEPTSLERYLGLWPVIQSHRPDSRAAMCGNRGKIAASTAATEIEVIGDGPPVNRLWESAASRVLHRAFCHIPPVPYVITPGERPQH